jgi:hypothetical protein
MACGRVVAVLLHGVLVVVGLSAELDLVSGTSLLLLSMRREEVFQHGTTRQAIQA